MRVIAVGDFFEVCLQSIVKKRDTEYSVHTASKNLVKYIGGM